jgi:hypothetical protein
MVAKRGLIDLWPFERELPKRQCFHACFAVCCCRRNLVAIQDPSDPQRSRVSGIVLNERAQPVAGIVIQASPPGPVFGVLPHTQTDVSGRFALVGLLPGHTYVNAFDEEAFYPKAASNFWDGEGAAEVELPSGGEVSGIVLTLKPVGRLEVNATTTDSGIAVDHIAVRLERDGEPTRWISGSSMGNSWLIPTAAVRLWRPGGGFLSHMVWFGRIFCAIQTDHRETT